MLGFVLWILTSSDVIFDGAALAPTSLAATIADFSASLAERNYTHA
jgi:hypothetical protein